MSGGDGVDIAPVYLLPGEVADRVIAHDDKFTAIDRRFASFDHRFFLITELEQRVRRIDDHSHSPHAALDVNPLPGHGWAHMRAVSL